MFHMLVQDGSALNRNYCLNDDSGEVPSQEIQLTLKTAMQTTTDVANKKAGTLWQY